MSHHDSLSSKTFWNASGSLAATMARMVAAIVIARQLGPELAGRYGFLAWMIEFTIIVVAFGFPNTLTRYLAEMSGKGEYEGGRNLLGWIARRYLVFMVLGATGVFIISTEYLLKKEESEIAYILSILLILQGISALVTSALSGGQKFREIAKINICSALVLIIFQPFCTLLMGLTGALLGAAISYTIPLIWIKPIISSALTQKFHPVPQSLPKYALYTWLAAIVSALVWARSELFFLNQFSTATQAGYFTAGLTLTSIVTLGASLLTGALMPHFSTMVGRSDLAGLQQDYSRLTCVVALFAFPASLGGVVIMPDLITIVFGNEFFPAHHAAAILMATGMLAFAGVGSSLVYAHGESAFIFRWGLIGASMIASGCYFIVPDFGASGAAWVRLGVQAIMIASGTAFIHRQLKIFPPYRELLRIALASTLMAILVKISIHSMINLSIFGSLAIGTISYLVCLKFIKPLAKDDASVLASVFLKFPNSTGKYAHALTRWIFSLP